MLDYSYSFLFFALTVMLSFGLTAILVRGLRAHLLLKSIMDVPNHRSMHKAPIPRGGGLGVLAVLMAGIAASLPFTPPQGIFLLAGLLLLGFVSWLDDKHHVNSLVRLGVHIAAAFIGCMAIDPQPQLFSPELPAWLDRTLIVLGWAWFMNLYNFMDGIDGITGTHSALCALGAILVLLSIEALEPFDLTLAALVIGSAGGFLLYNWHPAKIFLGDVGSVPLGFVLGYLLLKIATLGSLTPALLLPLYYLTDSGVTIVRRALRREKIWQPHRQHFYQRAATGQGRHDRIVLWVALAQTALIACSIIATTSPELGSVFALLTLALLLGKMHVAAQQTAPTA